MRGPLRMRALTEEEERVISKLVRSRTAAVRLVHRVKIIHLASQGETIPQIMKQLEMTERIVRKWWKRLEAQGLAGLEDAPVQERLRAILPRTKPVCLRQRSRDPKTWA